MCVCVCVCARACVCVCVWVTANFSRTWVGWIIGEKEWRKVCVCECGLSCVWHCAKISSQLPSLAKVLHNKQTASTSETAQS